MDWSSCTSVVNGENIATIRCIDVVVKNLISAALLFGGSVAAIIIIFAGIKYVRSKGDPKNVQSAQQAMTFGIIGLLIVLFAFFIVTFVIYLTGASSNCLLNGFAGC